ncbi:MAG: tRNA (guanosine(37)-N1)-methyltransferase TrmD [Gammaproteobacteria bacterium]|nr:tRNA (guanosine(37)-N1)-methyltransferase TrmD [Gammaproteobacteria bacterium]
MIQLGVITLLPEMFAALNYGVIGRAIEQGIAEINCWNPRDWALNDHRQIDDRPYGGGPGMVMMYEPLHAAIMHAKQQMSGCKTIYLSPQGQKMDQARLNTAASSQCPLLMIAGRYEGIDERIILNDVDEEWSIGDFVLSGGEFAAMVFMDAIIRLLPGSLGHPASAGADSFMHGLLDYPQYTRPATVNHAAVPEVLLSGSHKLIATWQRKQSLGKTWLKRPDLLENVTLSDADQQLLTEFILEQTGE